MARYRNTGAPFKRDDGSMWIHNEVSEPTSRELARFRQKLAPMDAEGSDPDDPLAGVEFASSKAEKLARDEGLTTDDFEGLETDEAVGVDDVRELLRDDTE